jgi:hypothetical protein
VLLEVLTIKNITVMDRGAAVIVLVIITLIVLPFVFHSLKKKMKDMKFLKDFRQIAEKEKIAITQYQIWNQCYAIGIDESSKKILYVNKRQDNLDDILIDLSEVEKCRIANINRTIKNQDGKGNFSDRLELIFSFNGSGIPETALVFYDSKEFMPTENDHSLIENWLKIVDTSLNSK